jgi:class 3 adenylate cyclase
MVSVSNWLEAVGLPQYADAFAEADIDQETLRDLTDDDLKALGVSLGHRKRLLRAIADLREPSQKPDATPRASDATTCAQSGSEPERRQVSALFCDLVGSTALATHLDPEDLHNLMQTYYSCCVDLVARFGGSVAHSQGDGILARFGYPHAHEDDAERAVRCGLDLRVGPESL